MDTQTTQIISLIYLSLSMLAIYLSFRCNSGFDIGGFLMALFFPYVYIPWKLATCPVKIF